MKKYKKKRCSSLLKLTGLSLSLGFLFSLASCNKVEAVEEHTHTKVHVPKIEATCIKEGRMEYWYCTQCGKICSDRAMEHEITKEETTLAKIEHTFIEENQIDPTCEATGKTSGKVCSYCHLVIEEQQDIPALGHAYDFENPAWIWNGFLEAEMIVTCSNDALHKLSYKASVTSQTIEPTCTEEGKTIYTACVEIDNQFYTSLKEEILLPTGHSFDLENVSWEWENYSKAYVKIPCLNNEIHTLVCEAEIQTETIDPSCIVTGKNIYTAEIIIEGKTLTDTKEEVLDALGHNYDLEHISWEWDGITAAKAWVECQNDSTHKMSLDATITSEAVWPTCEENGKIVYTATIFFEDVSYHTEKEETLKATGHNYDYQNVEWLWDRFSSACVQAVCKNDSSHIESYNAEITYEDILATCVHEGKRIYTATAQIKGEQYEDKKEEILPIDPNHHEYDYESLSWQWIPTVTSYKVIVRVYCGCAEHTSLSFEEIEVISTFSDSTFEEEGFIRYEASIELLGKTFSTIRTDIIPKKQIITTEEEFLAAISTDAFSIVLENDIILSKPVLISGSFTRIDLNEHTLTVLDTGISIQSLKASLENGMLVTGVKNTIGAYGIYLEESSNLVLNNMVLFGGISSSASNLLVKDSDLTATLEYAITLRNSEAIIEESQIYKCYASNFSYNFFSLDDKSHLSLEKDTVLYTTYDAKAYDTDDKLDVEINRIDSLDYLTSNRLYKCISLSEDLDCSDLTEELLLKGNKIYLSLGNHQLLVPSNSLKITATYAVILEGSINGKEPQENIIVIDEGAEVLLKGLTIYGNIRVQKSTLDLAEVSIKSWDSI